MSASKGKYSKSNNRKGAIVAICAVISVLIIGLVAGYLYFYYSIGDTILHNVTVAGVDVGGMTEAEALEAVKSATKDTYSKSDMVVEAFGDTLILSPADTQVSLDVESAVAEAYAYGRSGFITKWQAERQRASAVGYSVDLTPYLSINSSAIENAVRAFIGDNQSSLTQSTWEVIGNRPDLSEKTEAEGQVLSIQLGTPGYACTPESLYQQIVKSYSENRFQFTAQYEEQLPDALDVFGIWETYTVLPVDAVQDPETFKITKESFGYGFNLDDALAAIKAAEYGSSLEIKLDYLDPSVTEESILANLFADELGSYTAWQNSSYDRATNLRLACQSLNGVIIYPGEVFSYNKTLGERTEEKGYRPGPSYVGTDTEDLVGGGICQVATTLYYCALKADLEILERECHQFAIVYAPLGVDATVSYGSLDFRFRNNTEYPILIKASASGGTTSITLYGTDDKDYYVKMESVVLDRYPYETVYEDRTEEGFEEGEEVITPYTGYKVNTYRCKYDKATDELISRTFEDVSIYSKRDSVICKVEVPTEPSESTGSAGETTETTQPGSEPTETTQPSNEPTETTGPQGSGGDISEGGGALPEE